MLELGVKFLISYLLGSLMGSLLVGYLRGGVDIRDMGSGNAGGTNALRTQGFWFALGVVIVDVAKGALAAGVVPGLDIPFVGFAPAVSREWLVMACAAAAVIGHVWPVYHRFRGGKGAATLVGTLLVLAPALLGPLLLVFAVVLVLPLFAYAAFMAVFIAWCHRSNIDRMLKGVENRNPKVMLFKTRASHDGS